MAARKDLAIHLMQKWIIWLQGKGLLETSKGRLDAPRVQMVLSLTQEDPRRPIETAGARSRGRSAGRQTLGTWPQYRRHLSPHLGRRRRQIDDGSLHLGGARPAARKVVRERLHNHLIKSRRDIWTQRAHWGKGKNVWFIIGCIVVRQYAM